LRKGAFGLERKFFLLVLVLCIWGALYSQNRSPVHLKAEVNPSHIQKGSRGALLVSCEIEPGFHISDATSGLFEVAVEPLEGVFFENAKYPAGEREAYGSVYKKSVFVQIPFRVDTAAKEGSRIVSVNVKVQPCSENGGVCYSPEVRKLNAEFFVLKEHETVQETPRGGGGMADRLTRALEQGSFIAFLVVFLGGLFTSLTPCVYPMIPITVAVIGAQAAGGKFRGFILSLFYVLGISTTFSTLGVVAARTGALFGSYVQHPAVVIVVASIFFLMGLSMLGVFILQMPAAWASKLQIKKRSGFLGAFLTGLLAGLIVSPCISPVLVVILTWVAKTGSILLGVGLLFSFSLGLGVFFVLLGTFSGIIKNLPKSGDWLEFIEKGLGILLVILAILFVRPILSDLVYQCVWAVFFVIFGTCIGAFAPIDREAHWKKKMGKAIGILAILVGGCLIFFGFARQYGFGVAASKKVLPVSSGEGLWIFSEEEGFRKAAAEGKPVLIDFFAEWCAACHELDEKTWADTSVRAELNRYVAVKLDVTKNTTQNKNIRDKYRVIGLPTVILFDSSGNERYRFEGFKPPKEVLDILTQY